jgi:hypothetical protein
LLQNSFAQQGIDKAQVKEKEILGTIVNGKNNININGGCK